ncbi:MAG: YigZ family protein [Lachnospiraceae bacterium]|nr:YigZ family protein [Lachnospiraceae bacterium]
MTEHKTIIRSGSGEVEEKRSRFIAVAVHCESEEEALAFIESVRKKHYDARHNCFAYIIGEKGELERAGDDGEPQKTAGQPILSVLRGAELKNVCCVVTRYFGGTLLGTGGLVRAYTDSARLAVQNAEIVTNRVGRILTVRTDYTGMGKIQYILAGEELTPADIQYADNVVITVCVPEELLDKVQKKITEATSATAVMEYGDPILYH